ncbi:MAG: aspartate--tRNA ligase [Bdellovibrionales bacterium]|nr:aspartate--tRNA ligase [Bdellovibrionales bacterium]
MSKLSLRTHRCGDLRAQDQGSDVVLQGWVHRRRDHGGVIFVDLRDRYGITQVVFSPEISSQVHQMGESLRSEHVLAVAGKVSLRPEDMKNTQMSTGEIEVYAHEVEIFSTAKTPPFSIEEDIEVSENLRLTYRYLDLRRPRLQKSFFLRHQMNKSIRSYLERNDFTEVETPILCKSTPEGARDYLVPSRVHPGSFYALPQSPQLFKQMLMISGFDRYYQIARCFRDEDLRADRQPEFTQLDIEVSFPTPQLIQDLMEGLMACVWKEVLGVDLPRPFPRMSYDQAMSQYASDKPDMRWNVPLVRLNEVLDQTEFQVFRSVVDSGGEVRGFRLKGGNEISRSQVDQLVEKAKSFGAKGLVWVRKKDGVVNSSVAKFLQAHELEGIAQALSMEDGDLSLVIADRTHVTRSALSQLKHWTLEKFAIAPEKEWAFLWVENFPLLEQDPETGSWNSMHHPFTSPHTEDLEKVREKKNLGSIRAQAYDLVLNGFELGGGSIRIHDSELQKQCFDLLGLSMQQAQEKFGFFLEALQYGTPPHGGIAFGLDRMAMLLSGAKAIRDVIAFPKTQTAYDLVSKAPNEVDADQLLQLHLRLAKKS